MTKTHLHQQVHDKDTTKLPNLGHKHI